MKDKESWGRIAKLFNSQAHSRELCVAFLQNHMNLLLLLIAMSRSKISQPLE